MIEKALDLHACFTLLWTDVAGFAMSWCILDVPALRGMEQQPQGLLQCSVTTLLILLGQTHTCFVEFPLIWWRKSMLMGNVGILVASTAHVKVWTLLTPVPLPWVQLILANIARGRECWLAGVVKMVQDHHGRIPRSS